MAPPWLRPWLSAASRAGPNGCFHAGPRGTEPGPAPHLEDPALALSVMPCHWPHLSRLIVVSPSRLSCSASLNRPYTASCSCWCCCPDHPKSRSCSSSRQPLPLHPRPHLFQTISPSTIPLLLSTGHCLTAIASLPSSPIPSLDPPSLALPHPTSLLHNRLLAQPSPPGCDGSYPAPPEAARIQPGSPPVNTFLPGESKSGRAPISETQPSHELLGDPSLPGTTHAVPLMVRAPVTYARHSL